MKTIKVGLLQKVGASLLTGLVILGLGAGVSQAHANSAPFSRIMVFGDSLLDTGNYYALSDGSPAAPYAEGRFCNGPVWVEYLANNLRMEYQCADNYAVGGATTGTINVNDGYAGREYPGLLEQIALFKTAPPITEPDRALFIVGAGGNDVSAALALGISPATMIANGVANTAVAVQQLYASGARHIIVVNMPDLGVTPFALGIGMGPQLTQLCAGYNYYLNQALDQLAAAGVPTIRVDVFSALNVLVSSPATYGFSNVTTPYLSALTGNPDEYLFWDGKHPTTRGHAVLAKVAVQQLISTFSPGNGQGAPEAQINALHGLVNSADSR